MVKTSSGMIVVEFARICFHMTIQNCKTTKIKRAIRQNIGGKDKIRGLKKKCKLQSKVDCLLLGMNVQWGLENWTCPVLKL